MDDRSYMYKDSPQRLQRMDYCNGVQGFINYATCIPRNISGAVLGVHARGVKIKSFSIEML
jgi:hypothetical protein